MKPRELYLGQYVTILAPSWLRGAKGVVEELPEQRFKWAVVRYGARRYNILPKNLADANILTETKEDSA